MNAGHNITIDEDYLTEIQANGGINRKSDTRAPPESVEPRLICADIKVLQSGPAMEGLLGNAVISKKNPTITQDLSR